jgi:hypothetical protein
MHRKSKQHTLFLSVLFMLLYWFYILKFVVRIKHWKPSDIYIKFMPAGDFYLYLVLLTT